MRFFYPLVLALALYGCACPIPIGNKNGTSHHMILGLGIVSVNDNNSEATVVTRSNAIGVALSNRPGLKFSVGYSSNKVLTISEKVDNVTIEVDHSPSGDITVDLKSMKEEENDP